MGDPTVIGWSVTVLYALACGLCYRALMLQERSPIQGHALSPERRGWAILTYFLLVLGLNKQLDAQTWVMRGGKAIVVQLELYALHRPLQLLVFALAAAFTFGSFFWVLPIFLKASPALKGGFVGLGVIAAYILVRAATFQSISRYVTYPQLRWLEPAGLLIVLSSALVGTKDKSITIH